VTPPGPDAVSGPPPAPVRVPSLAGTHPLPRREFVLVLLLFGGITAAALGAQLRDLDRVWNLGDPLFAIWRFAWVAHQLPRDPLHLFDANIFYPERLTLALSDPSLLPSLLVAPWLWLGFSSVRVYNLFCVATFAASGLAMYAFARRLTGQPGAALVAAVAFAFYPFRFEQYSHVELLCSFWMPLALWALHRTVDDGRLRDGLLLGAMVAGQALSSLYLGVFLASFVPVMWLAITPDWRRAGRPAVAAIAGAALAGALVTPVVIPHLQVRQTVGERGVGDVESYSAHPRNYLTVHATRAVYRRLLGSANAEPEKALFPGLVVVLLAAVALWPPWSRIRLAYGLGLAFAFDMSLGVNGWLYAWFYRLAVPFRGLRVPARFSMLVGLSLAVLAALGSARLTGRIRKPILRLGLAAGLAAVILVESWPRMGLVWVWPKAPAIYRFFDGQPVAPIAELPSSGPETASWENRYLYFSTFHWQRLVNGYSGFFPRSFLEFREAVATFPDDRSVRLLAERRTKYIVIHEEFYGRSSSYRAIVGRMDQRGDLREVVREMRGGYEERIYEIVR
jgi:hypothetical protein